MFYVILWWKRIFFPLRKSCFIYIVGFPLFLGCHDCRKNAKSIVMTLYAIDNKPRLSSVRASTTERKTNMRDNKWMAMGGWGVNLCKLWLNIGTVNLDIRCEIWHHHLRLIALASGFSHHLSLGGKKKSILTHRSRLEVSHWALDGFDNN